MIATQELDRIVAVEHPDPHGILGPHEEEGALVIRVFRPDAQDVTVLPDNGTPHGMVRVRNGGLFELRLPGVKHPLSYRLEVRYEGAAFTMRDPYAFPPALGDIDLHLAHEGTHLEIYRRLGAHTAEINGVRGTWFAVWAPAAQRVSVVGEFNSWDGRLHAMRRMGQGIWEIFIPEVREGAIYKYEIRTLQGLISLKTDPYAQAMELRPRTASRVVERHYRFTDETWMTERNKGDVRRRPMSIYEVHLGSWRKKPADGAPHLTPDEQAAARWYSYRELADILVDYVAGLGFTHIELMPVMEHPFDGSWGYQVSGYFAPTARFGGPDDFRYFVDRCHARGIGVILDWTPAHFPKDDFALGRFDGSALYEHLDPRQGEHKQWSTYVFNYGRPEVKNFLISNALYWFDEFHIDGLRVDAVASMLYLDYGSNSDGEWVPNQYGGHENLEAVAFLRELNERVHARFPGALTMAEESTAWPAVTKPCYVGGLGFDFKWNMGWMHDTLSYFKHEPIHRSYHHNQLTFALWYAFTERFVLPLSHDEVVHLKKSLVSKMPGDRWQMHANLRALYGYMWAHPGRKLLFMGAEIGQWHEWNFEGELDWFLLNEPDHLGVMRLVRDLNTLYKRYPALSELDEEPQGFRWIDGHDWQQSVISFVRYSSPFGPRGQGGKLATKSAPVICLGNFTPVPRHGYRIGVPRRCDYLEVLNTDAHEYGGSGMGNGGRVVSEDIPSHGFRQSIVLTLPPLSTVWLVPELVDDPAMIEGAPQLPRA